MGLHDLSPDGSRRAPVRQVDYTPEADVGLLRMVGGAWRNWVIAPWQAAIPAARALPALGAAIGRFFLDARRAPGRHAVTRFNHTLSAHRVFTGRRYPLEDVKRVRLAVPGATVNDVVVSIASGAVRHYLKSKRELTGAPLRVAMPINTRTEQEFGDAGNSISAMFCEAHVDVAAPLERLAAIRESTRDAKESSGAVGAREMTDVTRHSPTALTFVAVKTINALNWGAAAGAPVANFCVSNVPGPTVPLYLCGAEMKFWNIVAPLPQAIGLFFGVSSYRGTLFIAPTADRRMMPDPQFFERCLDRSMAEHVAAAERRFEQRPEMLVAAKRSRPGRRRHPGLLAMQSLEGNDGAAADTGARRGRSRTVTRRQGTRS